MLQFVLWLHLPVIVAVVVLGGHGGVDPLGLAGRVGGVSGVGPVIMLWFAVAGCAGGGLAAHLVASPRLQSLAVALGLLAASDALVDGSGGLSELRLHVMVVVALVGLYQDWVPYLLAVGLIALHDLVVNGVAAGLLEERPSPQGNPTLLALFHAGMVLALALTQMGYWRFAARAQSALRDAAEQASELASALSVRKALLSNVISAVPHMVYWKDVDGRYLGANAAYLRARGAHESQLFGRIDTEIPGDDPLGQLRELEIETLRTGSPVQDRQLAIATPEGTEHQLLVSVLPQVDPSGILRGVVGVAADITHVQTLERQLAQANRLEAIGQLAAGIAHEINTPVQFVTDNTRYLADMLARLRPTIAYALQLAGGTVDAPREADADAPASIPPTDSVGSPGPSRTVIAADLHRPPAGLDLAELEDDMPAALEESLEGLQRIGQIVRAMKDFSHPGQVRADTDLNRAIESTVCVCRNEWKYDATVELDLADDLGVVPCYEGEFKQVILNMIVNAAHAIQEQRRRTEAPDLGTIRIATRPSPAHVEITITDNGTGMEQQTQNRIFEPFFTTKPVGQGTGQGLALAQACIVGHHDGTLDVTSAPGEGTTFTITLPRRPATTTG